MFPYYLHGCDGSVHDDQEDGELFHVRPPECMQDDSGGQATWAGASSIINRMSQGSRESQYIYTELTS